MKYKIQTKFVERLIYYTNCPKCKKEVCGIDENTCIRNIEKHYDKCKKEAIKTARKVKQK